MALGPLRGRHWAPADGPAGRKILGFVFCAALSFRESLTGLEHKFMTSMINKLVKLESGSSLTPASLIHFLINDYLTACSLSQPERCASRTLAHPIARQIPFLQSVNIFTDLQKIL